MTNKKSGRPSKLTAEVVRKLEEAFKYGATVTEACLLSGISRDTFYQHFRSNQEFSDKMELSRNWMSLIARQNIAKAIIAGDIKTSVWLLDKHNSLPTNALEDEIPSEVRDEETKALFERLVQYRIDEYRYRLEAEYDLVPRKPKENVV